MKERANSAPPLTAPVAADGRNHQRRLVIADDFFADSGEYYFERTSKAFDPIIDFYMTGNLHKPSDMCPDRFREELLFWGLVKEEMAPCCAPIVVNSDNATSACIHATEEDKKKNSVDFKGFFGASIRRRLWPVLEDPSSSVYAKVFSVLSVIFVFASVFGLILGSMPEFQAEGYNYTYPVFVRCNQAPQNSGKGAQFAHQQHHHLNEGATKHKATDNPHIVLVYLEYVCIGWFTFEYISRLVVAPEKRKFVKGSLNLIDLFTILPFYMELCLPAVGINAEKLREITGAMLVIRVMRVLRVARVFKLARYSSGLQAFGDTMKRSITELSMLGMFLVTGIVFFSTVLYFLEKDEPNTEFYSIPAACWWCVVTMTTVGYGDVVPTTPLGKAVATAASVCGIIVLAFPISMIVEKFATAQDRLQTTAPAGQPAAPSTTRYFMGRFPSRRRACKEPLASGEGLTATRRATHEWRK
uniref:Uncharacterized protein n=1 Tax=Plectus sambesii TaxID=2011161 RepID=A0A914WS89_9BILA